MAPNQRMAVRIQQVENMGLIDKYLGELYRMTEVDRQFFVHFLSTFKNNVDNILMQMDTQLKKDMVDFIALCEDSVQLLGYAECIGATKMRGACFILHKGADIFSKPWCLLAFEDLKEEYDALKPHIDELIQLEQAIIAEENTQASPYKLLMFLIFLLLIWCCYDFYLSFLSVLMVV